MPVAPALFGRLQQASLQHFEKDAALAADIVLAYSQTDRARYEQLYPQAHWGATRNGADVSGIMPVDPPPSKRVLMVGSLGYAPNVRGLEWFIDQVLPKLPDEIELTVVGSRASDQLRQRLVQTRMKFVDTPPELAPLYALHGLCVIPLLEGSGTRGRILEALAHRRMVVTTTKGAEGLDVCESSGVIRVDDPACFAEAVIRWASSSEARDRQAAEGRRQVLERYDWPVVAREFVSNLENCPLPGRKDL
jgi:glycosyltransferase involved in cell wall biosynthesis